MKALYVTEGRYMQMDVTEHEITIPVVFRYYPKLDSWAIYINPDRTLLSKRKKYLDRGYGWYTGMLRLVGMPNEESGWEITWNEIPDDLQKYIDRYWTNSLVYFIHKYCEVPKAYDATGMETFYLANYGLANAEHAVCHVYGEGCIYVKSLTDCLVFIHGEYEII